VQSIFSVFSQKCQNLGNVADLHLHPFVNRILDDDALDSAIKLSRQFVHRDLHRGKHLWRTSFLGQKPGQADSHINYEYPNQQVIGESGRRKQSASGYPDRAKTRMKRSETASKISIILAESFMSL
jgi:hypothetical protein